jgi:hypothetical protein
MYQWHEIHLNFFLRQCVGCIGNSTSPLDSGLTFMVSLRSPFKIQVYEYKLSKLHNVMPESTYL